MAATVVMLFLFFLLGLGCFLLLVGGVCLLLRRRRKKKGLPPLKRYTVLAVLALAAGVACCVPPLGFFSFLRVNNRINTMDEDFVDTGVYVEGGYHSEDFTAAGVQYRHLDLTMAPGCPQGEPALTWDATTGWDKVFGYYNRGNYSALPSGAGVELLRDDGIHRRLFCRLDQAEQALAWYGDGANYTWQLTAGEGEPQAAAPDGAELEALRAWWEGAVAEQQAILEEEEDREGLAAGSALGTYLAEDYDWKKPNSVTLASISLDGLVQGESFRLGRHGENLCLNNCSYGTGGEVTHILTPLPEELKPLFALH